MTGQLMHLHPTDERLPCRWTTIDDAIQITCDLRGMKIQHIGIYSLGHVLTRQLQIVEHYRGQAVDELRIALPNFLRNVYGSLNLWDGARIGGMQQKVIQFPQSLWCVFGEKVDVQETQCGLYLLCLCA